MKIHYYTICLISIFSLFACNKEEGKMNLPLNCKNIDVQLNDAVKLSEFATDVELIKLSNDSLLKDVHQLIVDKDGFFYIKDSQGSVLQVYSPEGKYIRQIGRRGKGPGEYTKIKGIGVNNNKIYINDSGKAKLLVYDMNGNYLRDEPVWEMTYHLDFACKGDTLVKSYAGNYISFDIKGGKYKEFLNRIKGNYTLHYESHLTQNMDNGDVYWERVYNDTIFKATGGKVLPFAYINFGKMKIPQSMPITPEIDRNPIVQTFCRNVSTVKISDKFMSFMFEFKNIGYICLYDRIKEKNYVFKNLENDLTSVPLLLPIIKAIQNDNIYFTVLPDMLIDVKKALKKSNKKENKILLHKMEEEIGEIHEMDNPYIVKVTCK